MSILELARTHTGRLAAAGAGVLTLAFAVACAAPAATPVPTVPPAKSAATVAPVATKPAATPVVAATPVPVATKPAPTAVPKVAVSPVASPIATRAPAPAATPGARLTVTLNAAGGSGVTGTAVIEAVGNQTRLTVTLRGFQANTRHAGHIHAGTCENQGPVETPLTVAAAGADGSATTETTVSTPITLLRDGKHYIQYHITETPPGAGVVCGNIPM